MPGTGVLACAWHYIAHAHCKPVAAPDSPRIVASQLYNKPTHLQLAAHPDTTGGSPSQNSVSTCTLHRHPRTTHHIPGPATDKAHTPVAPQHSPTQRSTPHHHHPSQRATTQQNHLTRPAKQFKSRHMWLCTSQTPHTGRSQALGCPTGCPAPTCCDAIHLQSSMHQHQSCGK